MKTEPERRSAVWSVPEIFGCITSLKDSCLLCGSIQTVCADTVKAGIHSLDPAVKILLCLRKQVFQTIERKVCHAAAMGTDEMTVPGSVRIKVVSAVAHMEPQDLASVR